MNILVNVGKSSALLEAVLESLNEAGHPKPLHDKGIDRITSRMGTEPMALRIADDKIRWDSVTAYQLHPKGGEWVTLENFFHSGVVASSPKEFDLGKGYKATISPDKQSVMIGAVSFDAERLIALAEMLED